MVFSESLKMNHGKRTIQQRYARAVIKESAVISYPIPG